jgi:hypothetical protein
MMDASAHVGDGHGPCLVLKKKTWASESEIKNKKKHLKIIQVSWR